MAFFGRAFLLLAVNFFMILTIQAVLFIVESQFGIPVMSSYYSHVIILYGLFGFGGAFVSLWMSRWIAKKTMGLQVLDPNSNHPEEKWLVQTTYTLARKAGLNKMPEVAVYAANDLNAFATGPSRNKSLVAVSSGLLESMDKDEIEGVLGHEIAHIANGDMVTMTLIQGAVNAVVMIVARIISDIIVSKMDDRARWFVRFAVYMAVTSVLALLGSVVTNWFSRRREFRADYGGAKFAGRDKMVRALKKLSMGYQQALQQGQGRNKQESPAIASLKISGKSKRHGGLKRLFMTHPPLEERIAALEARGL